VRLAISEKHYEAMTSRPLLLSSIGRLTEEHGRQMKIIVTSTHGDIKKLWNLILAKAMEKFWAGIGAKNQIEQPLLS
jgi:hypothetical protein